METNAEELIPARPTHPGSVLRDELEARGISQKSFAEEIGMKASNLNELIHGKRNVTVAIAMKLEQALGIPYISWVNLQSRYEYVVRIKEAQRRATQKSHPVVAYSAVSWPSSAQYVQEP